MLKFHEKVSYLMLAPVVYALGATLVIWIGKEIFGLVRSVVKKEKNEGPTWPSFKVFIISFFLFFILVLFLIFIDKDQEEDANLLPLGGYLEYRK